jgi:hypothetical protein
MSFGACYLIFGWAHECYLMDEEAGFPYWQKRIVEIPDVENLSVPVESAIQATLAEHDVGEQVCANLAGMIIAFIDRKSDLPDKKSAL